MVKERSASYLLAASVFVLATATQANEITTYTYDALGRLVATTSSGTVNNGRTTQLGYDPAGNRSSYAVTGAAGGAPSAPSLAIGAAPATEGGTPVFTVTKPGSGAASASWATSNGSAVAETQRP